MPTDNMDQQAMQDEVELLRKRLKRRNILLDETRKAYLRDVVVVKEMMRKLPGVDSSKISTTTSIDLRQYLELYAPSECALRVAHGGKLDDYGGYIELVHRESKKVIELRNKVEELVELEQEMRLKATELEIAQQKDQLALVDQREQNRDNRDILSKQIASLKQRLSNVDERELEILRKESATLRRSLKEAEQQIAALRPRVAEMPGLEETRKQLELQMKGQDRRVKELEDELQAAHKEAQEELERYNALEQRYVDEGLQNRRMHKLHEDAKLECIQEKARHKLTQEALDESKRTAAMLKQQLADLKMEFAELRESNDREQEAHLELSDRLQQELRTAQVEVQEAKNLWEQEKASKAAAISKARKDAVEELDSANSKVVKSELANSAKSETCEADLTQIGKRALSTKLSVAESQEEIWMELTDAARLEQIIDMLDAAVLTAPSALSEDSCPFNRPSSQKHVRVQLDIVKNRVVTVLSEIDSLRRDNRSQKRRLEKYKRIPRANSEALKKFNSLVVQKRDRSSEEVLQGLKDAVNEISNLQSALEIAWADNESFTEEIKELRELLESQTQIEGAAHTTEPLFSDSSASEDWAYEEDEETTEAPSSGDIHDPLTLSRTQSSRLGTILPGKGKIEARSRRTRRTAGNDTFEESTHATQHEMEDTMNNRTIPSQAAERRMKPRTLLPKNPKARQNGLISTAVLLLGVLEDAIRLPEAAPTTSSEESESLENFSIDNRVLTTELIAAGAAPGKDQIEALHRAGKMKQTINLIRYRIATSLQKSRDSLLAYSLGKTGPTGTADDRQSHDHAVGSRSEAGEVAQTPEATSTLALSASTPAKGEVAESKEVARLHEELSAMKGLMLGVGELKRKHRDLECKYSELIRELNKYREENIALKQAKSTLENTCSDVSASLDALCKQKNRVESEMQDALTDTIALRAQLSRAESRYDETVKREQRRRETNVSVEIHCAPPQANASAQTTFKTPNMTLRRINSFARVPHRRCGPGSVTPAIVDAASPENDSAEPPLFYHRPYSIAHAYGLQTSNMARPRSTDGLDGGRYEQYFQLPMLG